MIRLRPLGENSVESSGGVREQYLSICLGRSSNGICGVVVSLGVS